MRDTTRGYTKYLLAFVAAAGGVAGCQPAAHTQQPVSSVGGSVRTPGAVEPADNLLPAGWQRLPRLLTLTTFMQRDITLADAVRTLRLSTGAKIQAEGNEVLPAHVSLYYRNVPLADVLRGMAAASHNLMWVKTETGELILRQRRQAHELDGLHPHTEAEAEMFRKGQELVRQVADLPPDVQHDLRFPHPLSHGVAFTDLPPAMQTNLRAMYAARLQMQEESEEKVYYGISKLPELYVQMDESAQETLTGCRFMLSDNHGGSDMWTHKFRDPKEGYAIVPKEAMVPQSLPAYPEDTAAQQQAQSDAACLKTHVHLSAGTYTLQEVLFALAAQAHFHFALPLDRSIGTRKFHCDDETLGDVLPRLCRAYAFTTPTTGKQWEWSWNWRKDDFFVFHWRPQSDKPRADKARTAATRDTPSGSQAIPPGK